MSTLASDLPADATTIEVEGGLAIGGLPSGITIGSEWISVIAYSGGSTFRVTRAQAGTLPAPHASGSTVTPGFVASSTPGGSGGVTVDNTVDPPFSASTIIAAGATESGVGEATLGAVTLRLAGPYPWAWDDAGFDGGVGASLFTLAEGEVIINAWTVVDEPFNGETFPNPSILAYLDSVNFVAWSVENAASGSAGTGHQSAPFADASVTDVGLYAYFGGTNPTRTVKVVAYYDGGGPLSAGSGNVYALIATPA